MRARRLVTLALVALFGATSPAWTQETVMGDFNARDGENAARGYLALHGWALADSGVKDVVLQIDGQDIRRAATGFQRPDVEQMFPGFPDSPRAGFGIFLDTTPYPTGQYTVSLKVRTEEGNTEVVQSKHFFFTNTVQDLRPFGTIDRPRRDTDLFGQCDPLLPRRLSLIEGWVLDQGIETGGSGVGFVELLVDGVIVANTRLGPDNLNDDPYQGIPNTCGLHNPGGPFPPLIVNCYGFPRLDVERNFPFVLDALPSGYRFYLDVGQMLRSGRARGAHQLTIRAGDITGTEANVAEIPVNFYCAGDLGNEGSIGLIETPREGRLFTGTINIQGWAVDFEGIDRVEVHVNGRLVGDATYPLATVRPDVAAEFVGFVDASTPMWRLSNYDTSQLEDGENNVAVFVIDVDGGRTLIGERTFVVNNNLP